MCLLSVGAGESDESVFQRWAFDPKIQCGAAGGNEVGADMRQHRPGADDPDLRTVALGAVYAVDVAKVLDIDIAIGEHDAGLTAEVIHDLCGRPLGDDSPAVEHDDAVAESLRLLDIVGDQYDGRAAVSNSTHDVPRPPSPNRVEVLSQLVEEDQPWPSDQRKCDEEALTFAARQSSERSCPQGLELPFVGKLVERPRFRMKAGKEFQCLADAQSIRQCGVLQLASDPSPNTVAGNGRVEAEHLDRATVAASQTLQYLDCRGLARAIGAKQTEQLTLMNVEGDVVENLCRSVSLLEPANPDREAGTRTR